MPILDVEIVGEKVDPTLAQKLADAAGELLQTGPGRTWVKMRYLPLDHYAENGTVPGNVRPVFVSVLQGNGGSEATKKETAAKLSASFAQILGRPVENIHILFEADAMGRVAFGGQLRS